MSIVSGPVQSLEIVRRVVRFVPPAHPFITYGPEDEPLLRWMGLGEDVEVEEVIRIEGLIVITSVSWRREF
jgi:hypothetical protein